MTAALPRLRSARRALRHFLVRAESDLPTWVRRGIPIILFLVSLSVFLPSLSTPSRLVFDEKIYVAAVRLHGQGELVSEQLENRPLNFEHPPVAKWLMLASYEVHGRPLAELDAAGVGDACRVFETGTDAKCGPLVVAVRRPGAVVAAGGVVGMFWVGLRLFGRLQYGLLAAGLLLLDPLYFLMARVAMLDIYQTAFVLLAFGLFLGPIRIHRIAGSLALGLAVASKLPAAFFIPAFGFLAYVRAGPIERRLRLRRALLYAIGLPTLAYALSYTPFFWAWFQVGGPAKALGMFLYTQWSAFTWSYLGPPGELSTLQSAVTSPPWTWPWMRTPVPFYLDSQPVDGSLHIRSLLTIGNPVIWWSGLGVVLVIVLRGLRGITLRTRPRVGALVSAARQSFPTMGALSGPGFAALLFLSGWLPFFLIARHGFLYYFVLASPFLSLLLARGLFHLLNGSTKARVGAVLLVALALWTAIFYRPVVTFEAIPRAAFDRIVDSIPWMEIWLSG